MMENRIKETVLELTAEVLGIPQEDIMMHSDFTNELGADTEVLARLIRVVEDEFSVEIKPSQARRIETPENILNFVENALAKKN